MKNNKVEAVSHGVIEGKLLACLNDNSKVAMIEVDLEDLNRMIRIYDDCYEDHTNTCGDDRESELIKDFLIGLIRLREEAFLPDVPKN